MSFNGFSGTEVQAVELAPTIVVTSIRPFIVLFLLINADQANQSLLLN